MQAAFGAIIRRNTFPVSKQFRLARHIGSEPKKRSHHGLHWTTTSKSAYRFPLGSMATAVAFSTALFFSVKEQNPLLAESEIDAVISKNENRVTLANPVDSVVEYQTNTFAANEPSEDRNSEWLHNQGGALFGVYDGHAGTAAARFAADELFPIIQRAFLYVLRSQENVRESMPQHADAFMRMNPEQWEQFKLGANFTDKHIDTLCHIQTLFDPKSIIPRALMGAFLEADNVFLQKCLANPDRYIEGLSGACALVCYILQNHLFVANAGDCRAVLGRYVDGRHQALLLSRDHTAAVEEPRIRAEHPDEPDAVTNGRIKGNLQPSRGIGDGLYKHPVFNQMLAAPIQQPFSPPYTTALPEVTTHAIADGDRFLVLASDGLWDKLSNDEVVQLVAGYDRSSRENVATLLIKRALEKASPSGLTPREQLSAILQWPKQLKRLIHDDITVTVVFLSPSDNAGQPLQFPAPSAFTSSSVVLPTET